MTAKTFRPEQARIVADAFEKHGVDYLFIGKGAAILLGYPGATQDVDLFPRKSPENGRRMVAALKEIGFGLSAADEAAVVAGSDFVQLSSGPFDVDLVPPRLKRADLSEQPPKRGARVGGAHERLAHEERADAVAAQPLDVGRRADAAFADNDPARGDLRQQFDRGFEPGLEVAQIAVVDPEERGIEGER